MNEFNIQSDNIKKDELYNNPTDLIIDTTVLCNNKCSFCWRGNFPDYLQNIQTTYSKEHTMDFDLYKKIIDDACQYDSIRWFSLSGPMGEPMLNERVADFYEYANSKNHFFTITANTNGLALDRHNSAKLLNNMTELSISVDSINPLTYEKIHGVKQVDKVIDNVKKIVDYKNKYGAKSDIVVRFTENSFNRGEFKSFEEFFFNLGVDKINYTQLHGFAGVHKDLKNPETAETCNQILHTINFNFKGDMTTCCVNWKIEPTFGNIQYNTISELWNNKKMQEWLKTRLQTEPCINCSGVGGKVQHSRRITRNDFFTYCDK